MGSDATGDVTHVYASFKAGKVGGVVIFKWGGGEAAMKASLRALTMPEARIVVVNLGEPAALPTPQALAAAAGANPNANQRQGLGLVEDADLGLRNGHRDYLTGLCKVLKISAEPLHKSTDFALQGLNNEATRKGLHVDLRGEKGITESDAPLIQYWRDKVADFSQDVVILWGRLSGKNKTVVGADPNLGPHLYGDSSTTMLRQIAADCRGFSRVVVTGAVPEAKRVQFPGCVYIGEFWTELTRAPYNIAVVTQKTQIRTFYILKQLLRQANNKRLVHVGMRSGNLDNYAFAGQTVVYLIAAGFDDRRIAQLAAGSARWLQSRPPQSPRVAYRTDLQVSPEIKNVILRTDLRHLVGADKQRFKLLNDSLGNNPEFYPIDAETQINANILYRAIKAADKRNEQPVDGELFAWYLAQKGTRGVSRDYLVELVAKIKAALRIPAADAAPQPVV